jgi:hypothetical protein
MGEQNAPAVGPTVFPVYYGEYEDRRLRAVALTRELAERVIVADALAGITVAGAAIGEDALVIADPKDALVKAGIVHPYDVAERLQTAAQVMNARGIGSVAEQLEKLAEAMEEASEDTTRALWGALVLGTGEL